jgi:hypothetical protein
VLGSSVRKPNKSPLDDLRAATLNMTLVSTSDAFYVIVDAARPLPKRGRPVQIRRIREREPMTESGPNLHIFFGIRCRCVRHSVSVQSLTS